jgi:ABC-type multidrug transport system ATPase subunit
VPAAVDVTDLRKQFGPVVALDGATWQAHSGQVTAVLGPNGAGKTTMVECCEGLRRQDSGTVRVLGADPWHSPAEHRARVGVMLQDGGLPNAARPVALLRHLSQLYAAPRPVDDLAAQLGIDRFATTPVRRLSGGQRQRVALAAALVGVTLLLVTVVLALALVMPGWLAGLIVSLIVLAVAAGFAYIGWRDRPRSALALTRKSLKEDWQWLKSQL